MYCELIHAMNVTWRCKTSKGTQHH